LSVTCNRSVVFSGNFGFLTINKTDCHNITEILWTVALNTTTLTHKVYITSKTDHLRNLLVYNISQTKFKDFLLILLGSLLLLLMHVGPWSYGSWIYNYLCNQCLSPLTLWVRTPLVYFFYQLWKILIKVINYFIFIANINWYNSPFYGFEIIE
jgi:hypothetical protein